MKPSFPTRRLPERPDLGQLKRQAKEQLDAYRAGDESAVAEVKRFYRAADPATFALHDAQLVLARNYGYGSWPKLKAYVDGVTATSRIRGLREREVALARNRALSPFSFLFPFARKGLYRQRHKDPTPEWSVIWELGGSKPHFRVADDPFVTEAFDNGIHVPR